MTIWDGATEREITLADLIASKTDSHTLLTCGKVIYDQITASYPKCMRDQGTMVYHGLEVKLDESKEAGYVEIS